jgi:hypothetical protein
MHSLAERDFSLEVDADVVPKSPDETTCLISHSHPVKLPPQDVEKRLFGLPKGLWRMAPVWLLGYVLNHRREEQVQRPTSHLHRIILMYEDSQLISAGYTKIGMMSLVVD